MIKRRWKLPTKAIFQHNISEVTPARPEKKHRTRGVNTTIDIKEITIIDDCLNLNKSL